MVFRYIPSKITKLCLFDYQNTQWRGQSRIINGRGAFQNKTTRHNYPSQPGRCFSFPFDLSEHLQHLLTFSPMFSRIFRRHFPARTRTHSSQPLSKITGYVVLLKIEKVCQNTAPHCPIFKNNRTRAPLAKRSKLQMRWWMKRVCHVKVGKNIHEELVFAEV